MRQFIFVFCYTYLCMFSSTPYANANGEGSKIDSKEYLSFMCSSDEFDKDAELRSLCKKFWELQEDLEDENSNYKWDSLSIWAVFTALCRTINQDWYVCSAAGALGYSMYGLFIDSSYSNVGKRFSKLKESIDNIAFKVEERELEKSIIDELKQTAGEAQDPSDLGLKADIRIIEIRKVPRDNPVIR